MVLKSRKQKSYLCFQVHSIHSAHFASFQVSISLSAQNCQTSSILLENVEHCGGEPEQAANMHMNRLIKLHAEMIAVSVASMSVV